jgi:two-component system, OmpR family, alkaline phosphatase synthesis response regulator PhoP
MNGKRILIADDEPDILEIVQYNLQKEGYEVQTANNGKEAVEKVNAFKPDLAILDIMMPGMTGVEVCKLLRSKPEYNDMLIVFLTALSDDPSQIKGLETGADDYLNKPISPKVLVSRVNAILRRVQKTGEQVIKVGTMVIDPVRFKVSLGSREITLAKKEFELLYLLASKAGKVFLRNEILEKVWGTDVIVGDRTIDVHIRKIRQKLGVDCVTTVKGVGYKFEMQEVG